MAPSLTVAKRALCRYSRPPGLLFCLQRGWVKVFDGQTSAESGTDSRSCCEITSMIYVSVISSRSSSSSSICLPGRADFVCLVERRRRQAPSEATSTQQTQQKTKPETVVLWCPTINGFASSWPASLSPLSAWAPGGIIVCVSAQYCSSGNWAS